MLAVWPDEVMRKVSGRTGYKVLVRPSMEKFPSNRNSLEVIHTPVLHYSRGGSESTTRMCAPSLPRATAMDQARSE